MTSPPHRHPDRSCWIQPLVWIRLDSLLPSWEQQWHTHTHTHTHTAPRLCRHTQSSIKEKRSETQCAVIKEAFTPVATMTGQSELTDQTAATSFKTPPRPSGLLVCFLHAVDTGRVWLWQKQASGSFFFSDRAIGGKYCEQNLFLSVTQLLLRLPKRWWWWYIWIG